MCDYKIKQSAVQEIMKQTCCVRDNLKKKMDDLEKQVWLLFVNYFMFMLFKWVCIASILRV